MSGARPRPGVSPAANHTAVSDDLVKSGAVRGCYRLRCITEIMQTRSRPPVPPSASNSCSSSKTPRNSGQLIRLTHDEDPWRHASEAEEPNPLISHTALADWFAHDEEAAHVEALWERITADPSLRARLQPAADPATLSTTTVEELRARRGEA